MKLNHPTIRSIILITLIGCILILSFDILIYFNFIKRWNLSNINNYVNSLGFILSIVTIYLLYINYRQQEREFAKMNKLNNDANQQLIRSNELILFNNQLEYLTKTIDNSNFFIYYTRTDDKNPLGYFDNEINRSLLVKDLKIIYNILTYCNENLNAIDDKQKIYFTRVPYNFNEIEIFIYKEISSFNTTQQNSLDIIFKNISRLL